MGRLLRRGAAVPLLDAVEGEVFEFYIGGEAAPDFPADEQTGDEIVIGIVGAF